MEVMKIVDAEGATFFMEGSDEDVAVESFGADIEIYHGMWEENED